MVSLGSGLTGDKVTVVSLGSGLTGDKVKWFLNLDNGSMECAIISNEF